MNTPYFQSFLAPYLHQFVQYKRALNRKYLNDAHTLRLFDRYLYNHNIADWHGIDSAVVDDFLASRPKVGSKRYNLILYAVRRFFAFAIMQQWTQRNPVTASPRRITGRPDSILIRSRHRETSAGRSTKTAGEIPCALSRPCVRDDFRCAVWPGIAGRRSLATRRWAMPILPAICCSSGRRNSPKADMCQWDLVWHSV